MAYQRPRNLVRMGTRVLHVSFHCRKHWQYVLSTLLVVFGSINRAYHEIKGRRLNVPAAASSCTASCNAVCAIPASSFEVESVGIDGYEPWTMPDLKLWKSTGRRLPDGKWGHGFVKRSREVWWANPHIAKKPLLCQWSWRDEILLDRYDVWNNAVYDIHASGPRGNLWMDMPGKFYGNFSSERVQNWLTYEPDPVIPAVNAGPWVLSAWAARPCMLLLGMLALTIVWATLSTWRMMFGTLGYLITLESIKSRRSTTFIHVVYLVFSVGLTLYGFASFSASDTQKELRNSPAKLLQTAMTVTSIAAVVYSVLTESTPVNLRMLKYLDADLPIPMGLDTPSHITLARTFVPVLLPDSVMAELKRKKAFHLLTDHVDPTFLRVLSMEHLQRIKSCWRVDDLRQLYTPRAEAAGKPGVSEVAISIENDSSGRQQAHTAKEDAASDFASMSTAEPVQASVSLGANRVAPLDATLSPADDLVSSTSDDVFRRGDSVDLEDGTSTTRNSLVHPVAPDSTCARGPVLHLHCKDGLHTGGDLRHKTSRVGRFRDILLRTLNITFSLREYWLLLASWVLSVPGLLSMITKRPDFIHCRCACGAGAISIQACYNTVMMRQARAATTTTAVLACGGGIMLILIGAKLWVEFQQSLGAEYGTLRYIIKLELRRRSWRHRLLAIGTVTFSTFSLVILLIMSLSVEQSNQNVWNHFLIFLELWQMIIAGFIMLSEVGLITPRAALRVPHVYVPMGFWQPSELVLAKLIKIAMLTDDEIKGLPHNLNKLRGLGVRARFLRALSTDDLLAIKRHLRPEESDTARNASVEVMLRSKRAKPAKAIAAVGSKKSRSTRRSVSTGSRTRMPLQDIQDTKSPRFLHKSDSEDQRASSVRLSDMCGSEDSSASDAPPIVRFSDRDESEDQNASGVSPDLGLSDKDML